MKHWTFAAGGGTTRHLVVAHLEADSSVALVAPEGFVVARWHAGPEARIVRGQWISPIARLRPVVDGQVADLDIDAEEQLVDAQRARWGHPVGRTQAAAS
jgi:hypothetical protein